MKDKQMVLVVDDEEKILSLVKSYLEINGYTALCAKNGREGMDIFEKNSVSLILLDLMLPDFSGEDFCRKIREISKIPIIMITAKTEEADIIHGLKIGADDVEVRLSSDRPSAAASGGRDLRPFGPTAFVPEECPDQAQTGYDPIGIDTVGGPLFLRFESCRRLIRIDQDFPDRFYA